jgi:glycosyltransferase involved in cell wall biosynthesis
LRLHLVGDGPEADKVHAVITANALEDAVTLTGRLAEASLKEQFEDADIYLSSALTDGTSVSLLEAMAHGLPVVVTDAPGNREWVEHDRAGWLARAGDAQAFATGLLRAANLDDQARNRIAVHNRALVEERADWHANARSLLAAYERGLESKYR